LLAAIRDDFTAHGLDLGLYWGNRNWYPYVADTMRTMVTDGVKSALVLRDERDVSRTRGCRQVPRKTWADAQAELGPAALLLHKLRHYFDHRVSLTANADRVQTASPTCVGPSRCRPSGVHSALHPGGDDASSGPSGGLYLDEHRETARWSPRRCVGHAPSSIWSGNPAPAVSCAVAATR
jgi:ferrochelatase